MNWKMLTAASCTVLGFMLQENPVKAVKGRSPEYSAQSAAAQHVTKKVLEEVLKEGGDSAVRNMLTGLNLRALPLARQEVADAETIARTNQVVDFQPQNDPQNGWGSLQMQALGTVDAEQASRALMQERDDARADTAVAIQLQQSNDKLQHLQGAIRAIKEAVLGNLDLAARLNVNYTTNLRDPEVFARVVNDIQTLQFINLDDHRRENEINQHLETTLLAERGEASTTAQPDLSQFSGVAGLNNNPTIEDILAKLKEQEGTIEGFLYAQENLAKENLAKENLFNRVIPPQHYNGGGSGRKNGSSRK